MPEPLDWKLFSVVIMTVVLSFILALLNKSFEYTMALLAIGSNIITAYVSYRYGHKEAKEESMDVSYAQRKNKLLSFQVVVVFLAVFAALLIFYQAAGAGLSQELLPMISIAFLVYILAVFSLFCFHHRVIPQEVVFKKEHFFGKKQQKE